MNRTPQDEIEEIEEEADYVNEPVCTVEKVAAPPDQRFRFFTQSFPLIAVCWLILLVIMGLRIHFTSVISENNAKLTAENQQLNQLKENQTALLEANRNLTNNNNKLSSDNENLRRDHKNLTVQFDNLTKGYTVLESKTTSLTAENQKLNTRNQELETQKNNLTEQIRDMETNWNELNVSRAQWSIDAYCPKTNNGRQCEPCQEGWEYNKPSCYAINNAPPPERRTWEEAREDCRGKNADLAVIHDQKEKKIIDGYSRGSSGTDGYWIGLRVENRKWKWVDGSDLTEIFWIASHGHCAISVQASGWISWRSVSCSNRNRWICKKKALSV
ncbi:C-type lectin domain family 12 member B-like [Sebastes umbrosus]|uniref:C-type lectin domain family 12 member B-like n=1 Tax=Sebastes umbrosus TaxID=72105 RepID=UPI00189EA6EF|nr:C-type lectin domain family 12 member B-like [Sebastes umbrosus]